MIDKKIYYCNLCGDTCFISEGEGMCEQYGLENCKVSGHYMSTPGNGHGALDDFTTYQFSLCEFCLNCLFKQFVNPPVVYDYNMLEVGIDHEYEWRSAEQRVEEDDWRKMKDVFHKENNRRNLLRKNKDD